MAYFCNKCGYYGKGGPEHPGKGCNYLACETQRPNKSFLWSPQMLAMKCSLFIKEKNHAHICIRSVDAEEQNPQCDNPRLHLAFHDLGENAPEGYRDGLFNEVHACEICVFISTVPDDHVIVVNCEAGVSRSPGVVLALRKYYGGDTEEIYTKAHPNIHVSSTLERVIRGNYREYRR